MSNYQTIMNDLLGDGARTTKYDVKLILPFTDNSSNNEKLISVMCKTTNFPGRTLNTHDIVFRGHTIPIPVSTELSGTWTCSFYNTEAHDIRTLFDRWMETFDIRGTDLKSFIPFDEDARENSEIILQGDSVIIEQYKFKDNIDPAGTSSKQDYYTIRYKLYGVFPTEINQIELNGEADDIESFSVTFRYAYYTVEKLDS